MYEYHWYEHHGIGRFEVKIKKVRKPMIVKLKTKDPDYPDLTPDQPYFVIGIEADDYRDTERFRQAVPLSCGSV